MPSIPLYDNAGWRAFDIGSALESLRRRNHPFVHRLERVGWALSSRNDLVRCEAAIERLEQVDRAIVEAQVSSDIADDLLSRDAEGLMLVAVNRYCRATFTSPSSGRKNIFGDSWLDEQDRTDHERIKTLRNKIIMHFGLDSSTVEPIWQTERLDLFLHEETESITFQLNGHTLNYDMETAFKIRDLAKKVRNRIEGSIDRWMQEVWQAFEQSPDRADILASFQRHEVAVVPKAARRVARDVSPQD